jgi:hypothetical protein
MTNPKPGIIPPIREPNGRHRRAPRGERESDIIGVALNHPHRRGNRSQLRGTAYGRLLEDHAPPSMQGSIRALYDAASDYDNLVIDFRMFKGIPHHKNKPRERPTTGLPIPDDVGREWGRKIVRIERGVIAESSREAFASMRTVVVDEYDLPLDQIPGALWGLEVLARVLASDRKDHPFR